MGKFSQFKLPLKSMKPGTATYSFHLGRDFFVDMESEDIHDANLDCDVTVTLKDDIYDLKMAVKGTITLRCDRCLGDLVLPVDTSYAIAVEYGDSYNDESDTLLVIPQSDNFLNVAYMLYDTVALTIPIKHVHPQGQCNSAMSDLLRKHSARDIDDVDPSDLDMDGGDDSADAPTDPRWDILKKLNEEN